MTEPDFSPEGAMARCLGLPLSQALAALRAVGLEPAIVFTGERAAEEDLTPRVIAVRGNMLIASRFRDGISGTEET